MQEESGTLDVFYSRMIVKDLWHKIRQPAHFRSGNVFNTSIRRHKYQAANSILARQISCWSGTKRTTQDNYILNTDLKLNKLKY